MSDTAQGGSKLFESLTNFSGTLLAIVKTRLELLSADLEEGQAHLLSLLMLSLVVFFCLSVGVVLLVILLVVAFWDSHRLLSIGVIAGSFLTLGAVMWAVTLHRARSKPKLFAASLSELSKDHQQLRAARE